MLNLDINEYVEFFHQPYYTSTLEYLQQYLLFLDDMTWERKDPNPDSSSLLSTVEAKIVIRIDDEIVYSNDHDKDLNEVLFNRLPYANHFSIDCKVFGNLRSFYDNPDPDAKFDRINEEDLWQGRGMADLLEGLKRKEPFIYKAVFRYPDDDNKTVFAFIKNGKSYDVEDLCIPGIVSKASGMSFFGNMICMKVAFENRIPDDIKQQLRNAVRSYLSEDEITYVEDVWEEEDEDEVSSNWLLSGNDIYDGDLSETNAFVEKINQILSAASERCMIFPGQQYYTIESMLRDSDTSKTVQAKDVIAAQEMYAEKAVNPSILELDHCFYDEDKFSVAGFVWKDHKLQLVGTVL